MCDRISPRFGRKLTNVARSHRALREFPICALTSQIRAIGAARFRVSSRPEITPRIAKIVGHSRKEFQNSEIHYARIRSAARALRRGALAQSSSACSAQNFFCNLPP